MAYCVARWVGTGTEEDPFRIPGATSIIDLRPNERVAEGLAWAEGPVPAANVVYSLGTDPLARLSNKRRSDLSTLLGYSVADMPVADIVVDCVLAGLVSGRPLRPTNAGRLKVRLGAIDYDAPVVTGGAVISDNFDTVDSATVGAQLTWFEAANSGKTWPSSNKANELHVAHEGVSTRGIMRAEQDLATANHYTQAVVVKPGTNTADTNIGPAVRCDPAMVDANGANANCYAFVRTRGDTWILRKLVGGAITNLAVSAAGAITDVNPHLFRLEVDGSALNALIAGASVATATDTSLVGHLRTGMFAFLGGSATFTTALRADNFEAGDIVATTVVGAEWATSWDVAAVVAKEAAVSWDVDGPVAAEWATSWDVHTPVGQEWATSWQVTALAGSTAAVLWNVEAVVGRTWQTSWDVSAVPFFVAADWLWKKIPGSPALNPASAAMVAELDDPGGATGGGQIVNIVDFGARTVDQSLISGTTPRYDVAFTDAYGRTGDPNSTDTVPIPDGTTIPPGSDGHVGVHDPVNGYVYSMWQATRPTASTWGATWGGRAPVSGDGHEEKVPEASDKGESTAAGISVFAGIVRIAELEAGVIPHALQFASDMVSTVAHQYPATSGAKGTNVAGMANPIPLGARIQLDPAFDVSTITGAAQRIIAKALQDYGAYCIDNTTGPRIGIQCEYIGPSENGVGGVPLRYDALGLSWDYYQLDQIPWSQLRVLDTWDGTSSATTVVGQEWATSWSVAAPVGKTLPVRWNTLSRVGQEAPVRFDVRRAVGVLGPMSWDVQYLENGRAWPLLWDVDALVEAGWDVRFDVRQKAGVTGPMSWDVAAPTGSPASFVVPPALTGTAEVGQVLGVTFTADGSPEPVVRYRWKRRTPIAVWSDVWRDNWSNQGGNGSAEWPLQYEVRQRAGAEWAMSWAVESGVGVTAPVAWDVEAHVGAEWAVSFDVLTTVVVQAEIAFDVAASPGVVGVAVEILWDVAAPVGITRPTSWHVRSLVAVEAPISWDVRMVIARTFAVVWHLQAHVGQLWPLSWDVHVSVGGGGQSVWSDEWTDVWSQEVEVTDPPTIAGRDHPMRWDVRQLVGAEWGLSWEVWTSLAIEAGIRWRVHTNRFPPGPPPNVPPETPPGHGVRPNTRDRSTAAPRHSPRR